jgi:hypothetical protein
MLKFFQKFKPNSLFKLFEMENKPTAVQSSVKTKINDYEENESIAIKKQKLNQEESESTTNSEVLTKSDTSVQLIKKRKYALLVGYSGEGYFGLQRYDKIMFHFK